MRRIRIFTLHFQDYAKDCIEKHNLHLSLGINTIVVLQRQLKKKNKCCINSTSKGILWVNFQIKKRLKSDWNVVSLKFVLDLCNCKLPVQRAESFYCVKYGTSNIQLLIVNIYFFNKIFFFRLKSIQYKKCQYSWLF